jgi:hypothetical protein
MEAKTTKAKAAMSEPGSRNELDLNELEEPSDATSEELDPTGFRTPVTGSIGEPFEIPTFESKPEPDEPDEDTPLENWSDSLLLSEFTKDRLGPPAMCSFLIKLEELVEWEDASGLEDDAEEDDDPDDNDDDVLPSGATSSATFLIPSPFWFSAKWSDESDPEPDNSVSDEESGTELESEEVDLASVPAPETDKVVPDPELAEFDVEAEPLVEPDPLVLEEESVPELDPETDPEPGLEPVPEGTLLVETEPEVFS